MVTEEFSGCDSSSSNIQCLHTIWITSSSFGMQICMNVDWFEYSKQNTDCQKAQCSLFEKNSRQCNAIQSDFIVLIHLVPFMWAFKYKWIHWKDWIIRYSPMAVFICSKCRIEIVISWEWNVWDIWSDNCHNLNKQMIDVRWTQAKMRMNDDTFQNVPNSIIILDFQFNNECHGK